MPWKTIFFLQLDRYLKNDFQLETCLKTRSLKRAGIRTLDERKPRPFFRSLLVPRILVEKPFGRQTFGQLWNIQHLTKDGISVDQTWVGKMFVGRMFLDEKAWHHLLPGYTAWQCSGSFLFVGLQQGYSVQGSLTEGEGSVQLTSLCLVVSISSFLY